MAKIIENAILIYTDGSLDWKGRKGGYGFLYVYVDRVGDYREISRHAPPGIHGTTNNRMELTACIKGLEGVVDLVEFSRVDKIVVCTDSRYVKDNFARAAFQWSKEKWVNRDKKPILNVDLWKELISARRKVRKSVTFEWVKGHGKGALKDIHNDIADKLALESRESPFSRKEHYSAVRRKTTRKKTKLGSVKMEGQEMDIRISTFQWLAEQKLWHYRYEVVSRHSPYVGCIDWIDADIYIRSGTQRVRVNNETKNPRIVEHLGEVDTATGKDAEANSTPTSQ
ncbi:MAG: ribonuclease H family protein [Terriglobia bacterium]